MSATLVTQISTTNYFASYYQIGDPLLCTKVSDELLRNYGHYVQAINYPTVPRGQEKLRMAPTPHHSKPMIDRLVSDMLHVWAKLEIPRSQETCSKVKVICEVVPSFCFGCFIALITLLLLVAVLY